MAQFSTQVPHQLGRDGARARLEQVLPRLAAGFGDEVRDLEGTWHGHELHYGFTAVGLKIQGRIIVEEAAAHVHCQLPLAAMLFRGRLEKEIHTRLGEALAAETEP
ncbi:MAG: polyhydroxyalkanoic acid system family protein [Pirellulales bacterium]